MPEKHILLICPEPIRHCVQGIGIRFLEMAGILKQDHHVTVWTCNEDIPKDTDVPLSLFPSGEAFKAEIIRTDAVVVHGHISEQYFEAISAHQLQAPPLIVDLYDPFLIENLQYTEELGEQIFYRDRAVLFKQLALGDFFLASSEIQRMFYLGIMTGAGRITPPVYHSDKGLYSLIGVAPFGIEPIAESTLRAMGGKLKDCIPGITGDDIVLFFGGVYDWYDPETLMNILGEVIQSFPMLRVIFSVNPNQETTPQGVFKKVRDFSDANGWINRSVFFIPWFPYRDRFAYLRDIDIAVCLHKPSLETALSLRTRVLDYMNAGIPIIATEGGEGGRILNEAGAAMFVPPYGQDTLKRAVISLLKNKILRQSMGESGRLWVQNNMTWRQSLLPLIEFCNAPRKAAVIAGRSAANIGLFSLKERRIFSVLRQIVRRLKLLRWTN